ncbi:MAG TPA: YdbH domain-containing protein [Sphingomonas sp.]|nr:YdbH domain-containing protein [Sphingomonas sp.]
MEGTSDDGPAIRPRFGRPRFAHRRRIALSVALVVLAGLVALWLMRKPIAERFVDRTLAAAKVPARYHIADLALGGQRLTDVVIGDPAHPDLVADWIETRTRIGLHGVELAGVRAGHLRVRGRQVDGKLSLGTIDRLLPAPRGGAFTLPHIDLSVADGRMRLETTYGVVGLAFTGSGPLDNGFVGRVAIIAERLGQGDCAGERLGSALRIRTADRRVTLAGPMNFARAACAGVAVTGVRSELDATLLLARPSGSSATIRLQTGTLSHPLARADALAGTLRLVHQGGRDVSVETKLAATAPRGFGMWAGQLRLDGGIEARENGTQMSYAGKLAVADADASRFVPRFAGLAAGSPVAPLVDRLSAALGAASRQFSGEAEIGLFRGDDMRVQVREAKLASPTGAQVALSPGGVIAWRSRSAPSLHGRVVASGGGLPTIAARVTPQGSGQRVQLAMAPYVVGNARLALTPVTVVTGGTTRIVTRATVSGPVGDGRVDGLTLPIDLRIAASGLVLNPACAPLRFDRLAVSGLTLRPATLTLCPIDGALVRTDGGLRGGARIAATRLSGMLGSTPVALALTGATLRLSDRGFAVDGVQTRIGSPARETRLDFARIEGRLNGELTGGFAGGAGQIANVPLLLSAAAGDWRFAGGALTLTGALAVADAAPTPRFQPMAARDVALSLVAGAITAKGVLHEPTTGTRVADVAIVHALSSGIGHADLAVPALSFTQRFQPELLTRLTYGVIADVRGTVSGAGHIGWTADGVTSSGVFRTAGTDLAAAFGPVTGIATEIRFTDLLALQSAPGQIANVASVNPGIPVTDGVIRYRTLPDARVQVEGGAWPFAGGRLTLAPTLLDFSAARERRMTFRVDGVAADRFLQQFDFKNLDATGTFDGLLPMIFDDTGGRIEGGNMTVREGGGTLAYVGEIGEKDVGFWGNFAFQALKSLRYRDLTLTMNGPLAGEMVTDVRFAGISQGQGAKTNVLIRRLQRLPLVFNIRIRAPFRGLLDSAQSFYDPKRLIQRNLPALLEDASRRDPAKTAPPPVQPPASAAVPHTDKD